MTMRILDVSVRLALGFVGAAVVGCNDGSVNPITTNPTIDQQVRQAISPWGVVPLLPVAAPDPALVDLGRSLFFDKILSGNRDVACATCHDPRNGTDDGRSLAIGTGAIGTGTTRTLGAGRSVTPRNAPALFSVGLGAFYFFWDGRVTDGNGIGGRFATPAGAALPGGVANMVAAQAMFPVTNRTEMRGNVGDRDVFGNPNELAAPGDSAFAAIWKATIARVLTVSAYVQKFNAAYPGVPTTQLGFEHAANAIAAFEVASFSKTGSPFDRYLSHDDGALTPDAKRGALLFFGKAGCVSCHSGPLLGGQQFASSGVPQIGPGVSPSAPLDAGRGDVAVGGGGPPQSGRFTFRVSPLRNVELSAPYMHDGVYSTLEAVVRHYNNVDSALKAFDPTQLDASLRASYHGDAATIAAVEKSLDFRVQRPLVLAADEQAQLVAFLKSLTDPAARNLGALVPGSVPSGLPLP
jgi:cytochrome c peroxidase